MSWSTLSSGDAVEVLSVDGNGSATWRTGRLIHPFMNRRLYFLAFDGGAVKATISADRIRPKPQHHYCDGFEVGQAVEALVEGAWRPGVVSDVYVAGNGEGRRYGVSFDRSREVLEVGAEAIRARLDWIEGKWVPAEEKDKPMKSEELGQDKLLHASNTARKRKLAGSSASSSGSGDEALFQLPNPNLDNENKDRLTSQSPLESLQSCKKAKKREIMEDSSRETETSVMKPGFDVHTPIIEEPQFCIKALVKNCCDSLLEKTNGISSRLIAKSPSSFFLDDPLVQEKLSKKDRLVNSMGRPVDRKVFRNVNIECQRDKGVRRQTFRRNRRKNSKPRKLRIFEPSLEGDSMGNRREKQDNTMVAEPHFGGFPTIKCVSDNSLEGQGLLNIMVGSSDAGLVETSASGIQLSESTSEAQNEFLHSTVAEQSTKNDSIEKVMNGTKPRSDNLPHGQSPPLFEKCSFMWNCIESMEVFSLIPQHPHFRPLEEHPKDFREGFAIGMMITFSNLVGSIAKLQIADSRHKFDDILKALAHLEQYGFDVQHLQARLMKLLGIKEDQEQFVEEGSALKELINQKKRGIDRLNFELESVKSDAQELEQTLSCLQEERSHLSEEGKVIDSKLKKLESDTWRVEHALLSAGKDFEATISLKW